VRTAEPEMKPLWAHVVLDPETHTPALLSSEELAEINETMRDCTRGYFLDRCWIQAGPLT
jgi:hypothetical protein